MPNLVDGMKWFLGVYTQRFNLRHKCVGHLFSGRYKALPEGEISHSVADGNDYDFGMDC